jgi:hypothetical protein
LPTVGSALRGFGAEGADRSGISLVEKAPVLNGKGSYGRPRRPPMATSVVDRFGAEGTARVVAPASSEGHATCKRARRVKGVVRRRDKRCCV